MQILTKKYFHASGSKRIHEARDLSMFQLRRIIKDKYENKNEKFVLIFKMKQNT